MNALLPAAAGPSVAKKRRAAGNEHLSVQRGRPVSRVTASRRLRRGDIVVALASLAAASNHVAVLASTAVAPHAPARGFDVATTGFLLVCTMLVASMNLPGLCLFYSGMLDSGNVINTFATCTAVACAVTVLWFAVGYTLAFGGGGNAFIGGLDRLFMAGITQLGPLTANGVPEALYATFHSTYAAITPCLIIGAYAGRVRFFASILFCCAWMILVYCPFARMVWGGGFLEQAGLIDFAGGVVIHVTAGASALAAAAFIGPRRSFLKLGGTPAPSNLLYIMIGTGLIWATWLAFNGGSVVAGVSPQAAWVFLNTMAAGGAGGSAWLLLDSCLPGHGGGPPKPTGLGACLGIVAGLVCITPAALFVTPWTGALMGATAAAACRAACAWLRSTAVARGSDDACEVFGVHGVGGLVGNTLTAVFASTALGGTLVVPSIGKQVALHMAVNGVAVAWAYGATYVILAALDKLLPRGVRVTPEEEDAGLDEALHGEAACASGVFALAH